MNRIDRMLREAAGGLPAEAPSGLEPLLAERVEREGLLDVAYAEMDSPVGTLTVATTPRGLVSVSYLPVDAVVESLSERVSPRVLRAPAKVDEARRELEEYFEGRRREFDLPLDWSLTRGFFRKVLRQTARIGYGQVDTYAGVAARAGSPRAVRAAGNALGSNPLPVVVPCHRVLRTGGGMGGYGGGIERKEFLLRLEGAVL